MSDSELDEWGGYENDSDTDGDDDLHHNTRHHDPNAPHNGGVVEDDDDGFTVTEKHLNQRAILIDAQSLMGHQSNSGFSVRSVPNPLVELCIKIIECPLSVRLHSSRMHRSVLHLPDLKGMSRMSRDVMSESSIIQAEQIHGIVPYVPLQLHMAKNAQQIFESTRKKHQGGKYRFFVGSRGPNPPHVAAVQEVLASLPSGPKAFLTLQSRVEEVTEVLHGLMDAGLKMNGPYKVFAYEDVAGGPKFMNKASGERCVLHARYTATSSCCAVTVDRLEMALRSSAAALEAHHGKR